MSPKPMNPDRWRRVRAALEELLDLPAPARDSRLAALSGEDADLARAVAELLGRDADEAADDAPPLSDLDPLVGPGHLAPGTRLGPWRVAEVIASGGMGTVYRGERADAQFEKSVAIKLIKRGMDSEEILRRFRHERQVLAALEHPGIARLLDGGVSEDGQPYFVMEYVDGLPIDRWCDERALSVRGRLELFQRICQTVHYAHQRLVVHRDLKPSNILVTDDGEPKLLDFGVARMLDPEGDDDQSVWTGEQGFFGTPSFASPEQLRGERVTTASDVYSLGVVLYRVLTGRRPYELSKVSRAEGLQLVCEVEPTRPSRMAAEGEAPDARALAAQLAGDLDTIVLKALRKEPERRYASAEQLAEDVQRHLDGLPVLARPSTLGYRAGKFLRRNRAASLIGAALAASLLTGFVVSSRLYVQAADANEQAQESLEQAQAASAEAEASYAEIRRIASTFAFDVSGQIGPLEGSVAARERIVSSALMHLERLAREGSYDPQVLLALASAYLRLGDLQGGSVTSNLGHRDDARESYERALAMARGLQAEDPDSPEVAELLARALRAQADLDLLEGEVERGVARLEEALALTPAGSPHAAVRATRSVALERLADHCMNAGDLARARECMGEALELQRGLEGEAQAGPAHRRDLAIAINKLADILLRQGDLDEAEALCLDARALLEELLDAGAEDAELLGVHAAVLNQMGTMYLQTGRIEEAVAPLRLADAQLARIVAADSRDSLARRNRAAGQQVLGMVLTRLGRHEEALEGLLDGLGNLERLAELDPDDRRARRDLAVNHSVIAGALTKLGRMEESLRHNELALAEFEALREADPAHAEARRDLASCLTNVGAYHMGAGKDAARPALARAAHAAEAARAFQRAHDELRSLADVGRLAQVDEPYLDLLEDFVEDARELGAALARK